MPGVMRVKWQYMSCVRRSGQFRLVVKETLEKTDGKSLTVSVCLILRYVALKIHLLSLVQVFSAFL